jgi:hypothetical protein
MRKKKFNKLLTISLEESLYNYVKQETDAAQISISEWWRDAANLKIETDPKGNQKEGAKNGD